MLPAGTPRGAVMIACSRASSSREDSTALDKSASTVNGSRNRTMTIVSATASGAPIWPRKARVVMVPASRISAIWLATLNISCPGIWNSSSRMVAPCAVAMAPPAWLRSEVTRRLARNACWVRANSRMRSVSTLCARASAASAARTTRTLAASAPSSSGRVIAAATPSCQEKKNNPTVIAAGSNTAPTKGVSRLAMKPTSSGPLAEMAWRAIAVLSAVNQPSSTSVSRSAIACWVSSTSANPMR